MCHSARLPLGPSLVRASSPAACRRSILHPPPDDHSTTSAWPDRHCYPFTLCYSGLWCCERSGRSLFAFSYQQPTLVFHFRRPPVRPRFPTGSPSRHISDELLNALYDLIPLARFRGLWPLLFPLYNLPEPITQKRSYDYFPRSFESRFLQKHIPPSLLTHTFWSLCFHLSRCPCCVPRGPTRRCLLLSQKLRRPCLASHRLWIVRSITICGETPFSNLLP